MTTNEKQELNVLNIFIEHKISKFSSMKFPKEITEVLGSGADAIVKNMIRDGMITDLYTAEYEFNETGRKRYYLLRSQKRGEKFIFLFPIAISLIALAVAIYSVWLQKQSLPKPTPTLQQPTTEQPVSISPQKKNDTIP